MKLKTIALAAVVTFALGSVLRAEKVDTPKAGLKKGATHIVVGKVANVFTKQAKKRNHDVTRYVAEVQVTKVEKGEGVSLAHPLYVRYWRQKYAGAGKPPPGTAGHRGLPKEGETVRIYLARNTYDGATKDNHDGGYNVYFANGFERPPAKKKTKKKD